MTHMYFSARAEGIRTFRHALRAAYRTYGHLGRTNSCYYYYYYCYLLDRLQSIFNAAARLVFSARRSERIIPLLHDLHWLRVPERIQFRLCVLAFRCLNGAAISCRERSSDSRCGRSLPPPLIYHHDACCPVSAAINSW